MGNLFDFVEPGDVSKRRYEYDKDWCFQYEMRRAYLEEDLRMAGLTAEQAAALTVGDFEFESVVSDEKKLQCTGFIKRHEWLGTIPQYTTHWFTARYHGILAGVTLMSVPNAFSKLMGEGTDRLERLISRGACISWSPKCLASAFLMWCIKWMVDNTEFRLFTAYSDPDAKELGTIYQACNFYYLGQNSGAEKRYINPYTGKVVSDRFFRQKSAYKRYCKELGVAWTGEPTDELREYGKRKMEMCESVSYPKKHKYAYILGRDKRETKYLRRRFLELNKVYEYPKNRGE